MIWKKYILTNLFVTIVFFGVFATPQIPDKLIYKGDTLSVYLYLPDEFYKLDTVTIDSFEYINQLLNVNLFGDKKTCQTTACGREYEATWEIIENQLYLTGIYSCCYYEDSIKANLTSLFKGKIVDGKVKADWVTGNFISPKGKRLFYDYSMGEGGIFEYEYEFHFKKGKLTETQLYDNRKSRQSIYSQDQEKLKKYIYNNIKWNTLPIQDSMVRVILRFSANVEGVIDNVEVMRGYNEIYDKEAIRIIKSIPKWDVYFSRGKLMRIPWTIPIIFSEENRLKYEKQ